MPKVFKVRDKRNKGYFIVDNIYLNGYARKLGVHATAVYLSLCRHADNSQSAFPAQVTIAKETGMGERTVRNKIKMLEKYNIIRVERERNSKGEWMHNSYTLMDKTVWKDYPEASLAFGDSPPANDNIHHRQLLPIKKTNTKKKTNTLLYGSIKEIGDEEMQTISENYNVPISFVRSKYDDMVNWHESTGKRKKNWYATLRNWVKKDAMKLRKEEQGGRKNIRFIDPS